MVHGDSAKLTANPNMHSIVKIKSKLVAQKPTGARVCINLYWTKLRGTYSDVSLLARKTFMAALTSSLDNASISGYSDAGLPTFAQTLPMRKRPTSGIGSTREAHKSFDLHGSRSSGIEGCNIAFVDLRVISFAKENKLSPFAC